VNIVVPPTTEDEAAYRAQHRYCPHCGRDERDMEQQTAGWPNNRHWCACGWIGTAHELTDRVAREPQP
jgi:phage terminase large subunit GpA-like protein